MITNILLLHNFPIESSGGTCDHNTAVEGIACTIQPMVFFKFLALENLYQKSLQFFNYNIYVAWKIDF